MTSVHGNACCGGQWCTCAQFCGAAGCWGRRPPPETAADPALARLQEQRRRHEEEIAASFRRPRLVPLRKTA